MRWLAENLGMARLDEDLWSVLNTLYEDDVRDVREGDEEILDILLGHCTKHLAALKIFAGSSPLTTRPYKPTHGGRDVTLEDELRSEAIWATHLERALNDERSLDFRRRVLGNRLLTTNEAVAFLNSPATARFSLDVFDKNGVAQPNGLLR
jgi:hypothetical protein